MEYIVLDIETTGLSKHYHKITEIAAVKVKNHKIVDHFHTLINPETEIPRFITRLTGIDNEMVKDSPKIQEVMPKLIDFLEDHPIIAHNATFDHGFLSHNAEKINKELKNEKICTRKLASRILPDLPSKKLSCICEHFDIINEQAHRAMADTLATQKVFANFCSILKEKEIDCHQAIKAFERLSLEKCKKIIKNY